MIEATSELPNQCSNSMSRKFASGIICIDIGLTSISLVLQLFLGCVRSSLIDLDPLSCD
jgi:hypothetical protein